MIIRGRGGIFGVPVVAERRRRGLVVGGCLGVEVGAQVVPRCRDEPHHSSCYPSGSAGGMPLTRTTVRTARLPGAT